ncbi:DgyrCDS6104 [Dimorphilus gyrociliatus]|uniref:DgyrCDS6104 n=1 Tax=Dimorphilus gyrociliatus TaxID=2664684 RepID=A0A7I8VNK7_9ANNE|nr:DgyrCDS6104 [Dimorphilus gyrociliatus]
MVVNTFMIELSCPNLNVNNPDSSSKVIEKVLNEYSLTKNSVSLLNDGFAMVFSSETSCSAFVRAYPDGLLTIDIHERVVSGENNRFSNDILSHIENKMKSEGASRTLSLTTPVKRGTKFNCYFPTTVGLLIEYDFDELVFEEQTPFQNVKIYHSPQFGNMLILDDDPNLAESDIIYTRTICGSGRENFKDKNILILGGGDGGILNELLKQNPAYVTMVEIDQVVIDASVKYLRGICDSAMDKLEGDNYKVIVEDCVPWLEKFIKEGKKFDYVINDLTAIPVTPEPVGEMWEFMRKILNLSISVLSDNGKYFTQGNGLNAQSALKMYEKQLNLLETRVEYSKEKVFVPSYLECWVFYEVWKKL